MTKMAGIVLCLMILPLFLMAASSNVKTDRKVVILLGPPGSGKGTQAKRLTKVLNIPHISTGDLFRENINQGSNLGNEAKEFINQGKLVPDELVLEMLFERISNFDCDHGFLLDGFPRTIAQATALQEKISSSDKLTVINLSVPDELIVKRISGRLTCLGCGSVYNQFFNPPLSEGVCDRCEKDLSHRDDDNIDIVQERLRIYKMQTEPLIKYYRQRGSLKHIDGSRSAEVVFREIMALDI